ncbi:MAG: DUF4252 domain-containing protein [Candidatus Latescibacterota bacterium]|nr:MAG: DUF4252 domain-containing protein [Candidatus Latescibacterota bacterium]
MKATRITPIVGLTLILTLCSGCLWAPDLDRVRRDLEGQLPGAEFTKEFALSLGPVTLGFAKLITRFVPETEEARLYLSDVSRVKVAIYEVDNVPNDVKLKIPKDLKKLLEKDDWELVVKTQDDRETTWILCQLDDDKLEGIYVVVLDEDELVLVRAHGNLDRVFEQAMRENLARN